MKLLAITGVAGSGKTTLSNLLFNCGWTQTKFATPLKSMLSYLLRYQGIDTTTAHRMLEGDLKETPTLFLNNRTPRYVMQTLGTEWRDLIDKNLWVDVWKRNIMNHPNYPDIKIVIDDTRFHHEINTIREMGGIIIRIERPNNPNQIASTHISEIEMSAIVPDLTILNNSTPEKMLDQLKTIIDYTGS
jgi:hypothetical protein